MGHGSSGQDTNLNIDDAGDRVIYNAAGVKGTGSDVTALCRVAAQPAGPVVAYVVNNPNAQYIRGRLVPWPILVATR